MNKTRQNDKRNNKKSRKIYNIYIYVPILYSFEKIKIKFNTLFVHIIDLLKYKHIYIYIGIYNYVQYFITLHFSTYCIYMAISNKKNKRKF